MYLVRRQTITMCRSTRHKSERCRDERCFRDERGRRDERAGIRERSRSRERGHRYRHARSKERYHPSRYDDGRLLQGGAHCSAERYRDRRLSPGRYHATSPPPPPPLPPPPPPLRCRHGTGAMPRMSASRGGSTSAGSLRPSAAALTPRLLTARLSKASTLPELLSLQQNHGANFDGFHVGAFWSRLKALARGGLGGVRDGLAPMCEQTVRMLPEMNARGMANVAHAFAKARLVGTGPW